MLLDRYRVSVSVGVFFTKMFLRVGFTTATIVSAELTNRFTYSPHNTTIISRQF